MKEFLMRQSDKLILIFEIVFFTFIALRIIHSGDMMLILWITGLVAGAVGALHILITGAIQKASANPNNDKPKENL